jgi:hypothetical protein
MEEQVKFLRGKIYGQLVKHAEALKRALLVVEYNEDRSQPIPGGAEQAVERNAAGIVAAVGALRALAALEAGGDPADEDEDG